MTLHYSTMSLPDLDTVLARLWKRGEDEAERYGLSDRETLRQRILAMAQEHAYVLRIGEDPVCVFGAAKCVNNVYCTWFIATDRFGEAAMGITRFLRRFIMDKLAQNPGAVLELISAVDHPHAERWFSILGFKMAEPPTRLFTKYYYQKPVDFKAEKHDDKIGCRGHSPCQQDDSIGVPHVPRRFSP